MSTVGYHEASDNELVEAHRRGDPEAFGILFSRYKDRMWAVAIQKTGDPELAADAVQDGFIAAYRRLDSFRGDSKFSTWLHRIVINATIDRLRKIKPTQEWPDYDIADRHDEHAQTDIRLDVHEALAQIPQNQREALELVDMQGLSVQEAAQQLGVPEGTIKSRCKRGRTALASLLGIDG